MNLNNHAPEHSRGTMEKEHLLPIGDFERHGSTKETPSLGKGTHSIGYFVYRSNLTRAKKRGFDFPKPNLFS